MELIEALSDKKLFIFDMDGTITDTEPCHYEAYRRTIEALCPGNTVTENEFLSCYVGHPETEIYALLKEKKQIDFDDDLFFRTRIDNLFKIVKERSLTTAPFYSELEKIFSAAEFVTLTSQRTSVLARFRDVIDYGKISRFISVADLDYGKGNVLRDCERYLGYKQCECVIFEDYAPTLRAAMDCGVLAVGVKHGFNAITPKDCDFLIDIHKSLF